MKILLTGANGFVGSHIAETLSKAGHRVVTMVRASSNCRWLEGLELAVKTGDICRPESLKDAVTGVDAIIHCAGLVRAKDGESYYRVNRDGTAALVEAALYHNPSLEKFVYISSQAAMGPSNAFRPKAAGELENPVSDYGKSKLAGEKELLRLKGKIPFTILRPASVYGPRDRDIFIFFNLVHKGFRPRTQGRRYIQMLFVKDLARAALATVSGNGHTDNKTYFLAEERPYTLDDVGRTIAASINKTGIPLPLPDIIFHGASFIAENLARLANKPAVLNRQKIAEMMQPYWIGDARPAQEDMGIHFTKLEFGAKITYSWYRQNKWL